VREGEREREREREIEKEGGMETSACVHAPNLPPSTHTHTHTHPIVNFVSTCNVVCFLMGNYLASEFYMPTFWNTAPSSWARSYLPSYEDGTDSVPKHWHIKFRRQGITQKKAYSIQNMAKDCNQEYL